ncbi:MAG: hypothetical protein QM754_09325 [Tepidisphaeraceae bacterium]
MSGTGREASPSTRPSETAGQRGNRLPQSPAATTLPAGSLASAAGSRNSDERQNQTGGLRGDRQTPGERDQGQGQAERGESQSPGQASGEASPQQPGGGNAQSQTGQNRQQGQGQSRGQGEPQPGGQRNGQGGTQPRDAQQQPRNAGQNRTGQPGGRGDQAGDPNAPNNGITGDTTADARGPLTGENFRDLSDRLRDVEEMIGDPRLRDRAAGIRDRARELRAELKRHSNEPNWDIVQQTIGTPLAELRDQVAQEAARRQSPDALVPLDREAVPPQYADQVKQYYERLGAGR